MYMTFASIQWIATRTENSHVLGETIANFSIEVADVTGLCAWTWTAKEKSMSCCMREPTETVRAYGDSRVHVGTRARTSQRCGPRVVGFKQRRGEK